MRKQTENVESSMAETVVARGPRGYVVFDMPFTTTERQTRRSGEATGEARRTVFVPVLAIATEHDGVTVPEEVLAWARHLLIPSPRSDLRSRINTIGRLAEFASEFMPEGPESSEDVDLLVYCYLAARISTPDEVSERPRPAWKPISYATLRNEFRAIVDFSKFCARYTGPQSAIGQALKVKGGLWEVAERQMYPQAFFAHLKEHRDRAADLLGRDPGIPSALFAEAKRLGKLTQPTTTTLSVEEVNRIINAEQNPTYRSLWLLLAYAGPRLSEALNLWRCDVLPGRYSRYFGQVDLSDQPLVIFAHPQFSTYVGDVTASKGPTRQAFLKERFGREPRNIGPRRKDRAGWKGMMLFSSDWKVSWAYWSDLAKAREFAVLAADIREIHSRASIDDVHPYYYVATSEAAGFGPLTAGNVQKAFDRACLRVGIIPHSTPGAHIHGLRHYYEWVLERLLKLPPDVVQTCMRHFNINSQRNYGKRATDTKEALSQIFAKRGESL